MLNQNYRLRVAVTLVWGGPVYNYVELTGAASLTEARAQVRERYRHAYAVAFPDANPI